MDNDVLQETLVETVKRLVYYQTVNGKPTTHLSQQLVAISEILAVLGESSPYSVVRNVVKEAAALGSSVFRANHPTDDDHIAPPISAFLPGRLEYLKDCQEGKNEPAYLFLNGWSERLGGGFWPGLHIGVGATGTMKTQLYLQIGLHAALQGHPVYYLSLEMGMEIIDRLLVLTSGEKIYWSALRKKGTITPAAIERGASILAKLPFRLDIGSPTGWGYDKLDSLVEHWLPTIAGFTSPPILIIDYLQLMASPASTRFREDDRNRIKNAAYKLRQLARDKGIVVLALSSTARQNYGRPAKNGPPPPKPWMLPADEFVGMGKESGEIEYSADSVMFLAREPWEDGKRPPLGTKFHLAIAKQRHGEAGWIELAENFGQFFEVAKNPQ